MKPYDGHKMKTIAILEKQHNSHSETAVKVCVHPQCMYMSNQPGKLGH